MAKKYYRFYLLFIIIDYKETGLSSKKVWSLTIYDTKHSCF